MFYTFDEINAITKVAQDISYRSKGPLALSIQDALTRIHCDDLDFDTLFIVRCALIFFAQDSTLKPHVDTALAKTTLALKAKKAETLN